MTDLELLSNRLRTLENRFRRIKTLAVIACIVVAAVGIMGQARRLPGEVLPSGRLRVETQPIRNATVEAELRSQHFVLVDGTGKERASLVADTAGSVFLVMFDAAGKTRANLSVSNDGPSLVFYDPSGQARMALGSTTLVGSHVNDNGVAERAPSSSIVLFDRAGKLLFRTP